MNELNTQNFFIYLKIIQNNLDAFFENQKEYIMCKEGCNLCCQNAEFPFSEVEFDFLLDGFLKLDKKLQMEIMDKVEFIIQDKLEFRKKENKAPFLYECPMLINGKCSVYEYRGIVCRAFGLMSFEPNSEETTKIPFCAFKNLNYSSVLDCDTKVISKEKFEKGNFIEEPKAFNIKYERLTKESYEKKFNFTFGDKKPLIDWFEEAK